MALALPARCPRNSKVCQPLSQIIDDEGEGFICCGHNDRTARVLEQDNYRFCWKNQDIDEMSDWDERDIIDTVSVLIQAVSITKNKQYNT